MADATQQISDVFANLQAILIQGLTLGVIIVGGTLGFDFVIHLGNTIHNFVVNVI